MTDCGSVGGQQPPTIRDDIESGEVWEDETYWAERAADLSLMLEKCEASKAVWQEVANGWRDQAIDWMQRAIRAEESNRDV